MVGARGSLRPVLGPLFPCRSPGCPAQIAPAALESLAPGEGSQDRNAFTRLSFIHETIKFFLFFLLKKKKVFFLIKKKGEKKRKAKEEPDESRLDRAGEGAVRMRMMCCHSILGHRLGTSSCHTLITSLGRAREVCGETESFWPLMSPFQ